MRTNTDRTGPERAKPRGQTQTCTWFRHHWTFAHWEMGKPCLVASEDLPNSQVLQYLQTKDEKLLCSDPPVKPRAGEVYLYSPLNDQFAGMIYYGNCDC